MKHFFLLIFSVMFSSCAVNQLNTQTKEPLYNYDVEQRVEELGIKLITPEKPVANYVNVVKTGNLLFLSGKIPMDENNNLITGKVGKDFTAEQGYKAARLSGEAQLSVLKAAIGDLNKVVRIVKVNGFVNAAPDFTDLPKVVNGYSDLMVEVFGERGKHTRAAVGMASLPLGAICDIDMIVEVQE